ncbi:MAG: SurA N-terminal domain-containing protein [Methylococcales bacterium]|nr:SurA N-terminal domain-containing protein [Methylococcales bacterium]
MLTKIREKSQGAFAGVILTVICVPFVLWGINNYINDGQESPVASVGKKDFYQHDVTKAVEKYRQSLGGLAIDEASMKSQALSKLIKDEVLLQYVHHKGLTISDDAIRDFIHTLPYFQTDGKFDEAKYKSMLSSQRMSSPEFVSQIKNALVMEQFQKSVLESSFATPYDLERVFKIQNQQRDVEYVTVPVAASTQTPSDDAIKTYYDAHQTQFQVPEQMSVEYIELTLEDLAKTVEVTDEKVKAFYEEQKAQYSTPERRRVAHILFEINDKQDEKTALEKATKTKADLASKDFATLAKELSDDKVTGKDGGDLGLFSAGVMEKDFDNAAIALKQGEISAPVKSQFGYHLIKVIELTPEQIKPFESVKAEVTKAYQKSQAENLFYQQGEVLTESAYQNSDNLQASASQLNLTIKKTGLFTKMQGEGIAAEEKIRNAAFSDEVLNGTNSTPIEVSNDHLVVLRMLEHKAAENKPLEQVKPEIVKAVQLEQAQQKAIETAKEIKTKLLAGETLTKVAADYKLPVKKEVGLTRMKKDFNVFLNEAIFKAAKPVSDKPSIFTVGLASHEQVVVSLTKVQEGTMTEDDKKKIELAKKNISKAVGDSEFNSLINTLEDDADVEINLPATAAQ